MFQSVNDESLAQSIHRASHKVVYISPGVGPKTVDALERAIEKNEVSLTIIIDSDEDAHRIGYGDYQALEKLHELTKKHQFPLRQQPGLRLGVLVADDELVVWAPTAQSVERECDQAQPNAISLGGPAVELVEDAVGADHSDVLPMEAEIGTQALLPEALEKTVKSLKADPPAPFDLAQKTRVFSTRFQFVECEVRGATWTGREVKLSSLILNSDLPGEVQEIFNTTIRPFQAEAELPFEIPLLHRGKKAFERDGTPMMTTANQSEILNIWSEIRGVYLTHLKGFGWLIRKSCLSSFRDEVSAFDEVLKVWVDAFKKHTDAKNDELVSTIVESIWPRVQRAKFKNFPEKSSLSIEVKKGLERMRVIEPKVRTVLKDVSWDSSRDNEFNEALKKAFTADERKGWFNEFTAARQQ